MVTAIILILFGYLLSYIATVFLIKSKDNCPYKCESYFEIGYLVMGRASIFFNAICIAFTTAGFLIVYYLILGETVAGILNKLTGFNLLTVTEFQ